jgi:glycosyltransferase involved in cell wall biosynthesis
MKILNIGGYTWDIGGPPKVIYDHAIVQMKLGAEVTILTLISEGQKLYTTPQGATIISLKRHWFSKLWAEFSIELYHWVKKHGEEYDIIHIHGIWHFAGITPYLAGLKTPKCITIHGLLDPWTLRKGYWKKYLFGLLFQKSIIRNTELILVLNVDEKADLKGFIHFEHPNVVTIPNGISTKEFELLPAKQSFKKRFNIPPEKKIILFMSRINLKKGLDLLLPAFKEVLTKRDDTILIIAGPDDGYQTITEDFIDAHHLQNQIQLVGMLTGEVKKEALADATIFALPSHSEGFSIAALEALISGVPSLFSDKVGFGEAIIETKSAHIIDLTVESISNGINKMLDDNEYCENLSKNGIELVKSRYDIEVVGEKMYREFQKITLSNN